LFQVVSSKQGTGAIFSSAFSTQSQNQRTFSMPQEADDLVLAGSGGGGGLGIPMEGGTDANDDAAWW
jgi:hypothetical protein